MKKNTLFLFFSQNFCLHLQAKLLITPVFYTKGYVVSTTQFTASRHLRSQWHHHCEAIAHTSYNNTPAPHSVIEQGAGFLPQRSSFLIVGKFLLFTFKLLEEMNLYRCQFILGTFFELIIFPVSFCFGYLG